MVCPKCGQALPEDSEFCQYCGSKLAGASVPAGNAAPASAPELAGKTCPFCKAPFMEGEAVVFCSHCEMPHHLECWKENGGCTTFGCTGNIGKIIGAEQKNAQSAPTVTRRPAARNAPKSIPYPQVRVGAEDEQEAKKTRFDTIDAQAKAQPQYTILSENTECVLQGNLPVILKATTLRKDKEGKLSAVCAFVSLADAIIQAMQVDIYCSDIWREKLEPICNVQYIDLAAKRDETFGDTLSINVPDTKTRILNVVVRKIMLSDGTLLSKAEENTNIPERRLLEEALNDELAEEYRTVICSKAKYVPDKKDRIWICACGAINRADEAACHTCGCKYISLIEGLSAERLLKSLEKRSLEQKVLEEKAAREEVSRRRAAETARLQQEREKQIKLQQEREAQAKAAREQAEREETEKLIKSAQKKKKRNRITALSSIAAIAVLLICLKGFGVIGREDADPVLPKEDSAVLESVPSAAPEASPPQTEEERIYLEAEQLAADGKIYEAATTFYTIKEYKDAWDRCFSLWGKITSRRTISISPFSSFAGINEDGSVDGFGFNGESENIRELSTWGKIEAIESENYSICGLTSDGKVLTASVSSIGFSVSDWEDIVAISVGDSCIVGLKADGTVLAELSAGAGQDYGQCEVSEWKDIIMVSTGGTHTVGLKTDGTVVAVGSNQSKQCDITEWKDVVYISTSKLNTVGVRRDGTVVAVGSNQYGQCAVLGWENITEVSIDTHYTIGLKMDGTVVSTAAAHNLYPWTDIVQISARWHPIGLRSNGDVVLLLDSTVRNGQENKLTMATGMKVPNKE